MSSELPKVNGGVWFQIWNFLAPVLVPVPFSNLCSGQRESQDKATVFSLERLHHQTLSSLVTWR